MNTTSARRFVSASLSVGVGAALLAVLITPASAQQPVERVEITGSALKRIDAETALPVQIITREEIEKTGAASVEQFLQAVGVAVQGNNNTVAASTAGLNAGGVSSVSLRGLGSQRTLVLIDGKRVAGGGTLTDSVSVDVNHIPASAIERVEVLKDGASAIYGSDAIGGVINFILRKDYRGGEVTAHADITQHPGGKGAGVSALIGWGDLATKRFSATLIVDARHEDGLFGRQRDFASQGITPKYLNDTSSGNTFPANFAAADGSFGTRNLFFPNCPGPYSHYSPLFADILGSRGCRFDPSGLVSLIPETDQQSIFGTLRWALTPQVEGYGQFSYSHKEQRTIIQPNPLSDQFALPDNHPLFSVAPFNGANTFLLRPTSPYYPTAFVVAQTGGATPDLLIRYRSVITGNRDFTDLSDQTRVVLGVKGSVSKWDYDASFLHIDTNLAERLNSGYPLATKILPLLDSGQVNPFGPNTPAIQAAADATQFRGDSYKTKTSIDGLQAKVTRDLTEVNGRPVALALGAEARKERFQLIPSAEIVIGDIEGYGGNNFAVDRSRNVGSGFLELNVPVGRTLEFTAAARHDHYEGVGDRTSPKLGARWTPTREVLLRGAMGNGFRAPSLTELYTPQTLGVSSPGLSDPLRCPTSADARDCVTQFPITLGGNAALKPELSTHRSLGLVLEPTRNFSIGIDYWEVDLKDTIIFGVAPTAILADPAKFGFLITRGPVGTGAPCAGCPGPILDIFQGNLNFGETNVRGWDLDLRYRIPEVSGGALTIGMNGTYLSKYLVQNIDGTFSSINGMVNPITNGAGGVIPRWRHYLFFDWKRAPWNFTLAQQYQNGYTDLAGTFDDPSNPTPVQHPRVAPYKLYHFYGSYTGLANNKNLKLTFGIRNLFDTAPPYTNAGGQNFFQAGYDPGYADPRGRTFILSLTYKFM